MSEVIRRLLSQYQIFNYVMAGGVFIYGLSVLGIYSVKTSNFFIDLILYYVLGLIFSRAATVFIEPLLQGLGFVRYSVYKRYVKAVKKDPIIDDMSQQNNMYKTMLAAISTLGLTALLTLNLSGRAMILTVTVVVVVVTILLLSYRKQVMYINDRIDVALLSRKKK